MRRAGFRAPAAPGPTAAGATNPDLEDLRARLPRARPHAESLLNLGPVRQAFADSRFGFLPRAVDQTWSYQRLVPITVTGFSPFSGAVLYGASSCLADWLRDPFSSARLYNARDRLVREVLFAVHDYLHCWAYAAIRRLAPGRGFGSAPITARNLEDFVFCHLLTEAAAVVGLDYWYMATLRLDELCDIGTTVAGVTVSYHERYLAEYRRFRPGFRPQSRPFFAEIATFYCTGEFPGFSAEDLDRSPRLFYWLEHELNYGETQRRYTRRWLLYLSHHPPAYGPVELAAPVSLRAGWKRQLIGELGELLWAKIKRFGLSRQVERVAPIAPGEGWRSPLDKAPDFRFVNCNACDEATLARAAEGMEQADFDYLFYQYLAGFVCGRFDPAKRARLDEVRRSRDFRRLADLCRGEERLPANPAEPRDILILN